MGTITLIAILMVCSRTLAFAKTVNVGLKNKHLTIVGEIWHPFLYVNFDENGTATNYRGIMYDLVLFMQRAKNFTFTMVYGDTSWGQCYAVNNCTGMIGMVNREEVDIALGNPNFHCNKIRFLRIPCCRTILPEHLEG